MAGTRDLPDWARLAVSSPSNFVPSRQALVDYRGFRLIAMSLLPINAKTLVYGRVSALWVIDLIRFVKIDIRSDCLSS